MMSPLKYFYISLARKKVTQYQREEMEIEAYLVRLGAVQLLPVIPDFFRPFANDSLRKERKLVIVATRCD